MDHIDIDEIDPFEFGGSERRSVAEAVNATDVAINYYRIAPGEGLPGGLHTHMDQEEIFVVLSGEATFETLDGVVTVAEGDAYRAAPGDFQSGTNESAEELILLALGAPPDSADVRLPVECWECEFENVRFEVDVEGVRFVCPECASEFIPDRCPECGCDDLRVSLVLVAESPETGVVCQDCDTVFDRPPVE